MALINAVAMFEIFNKAGFTVGWWTSLATPAWLLMSLTGFVIYRYRETRAMTPSQIFEIRYSRPFRLFMGSLAFFAGVLNYGIFSRPSAGSSSSISADCRRSSIVARSRFPHSPWSWLCTWRCRCG